MIRSIDCKNVDSLPHLRGAVLLVTIPPGHIRDKNFSVPHTRPALACANSKCGKNFESRIATQLHPQFPDRLYKRKYGPLTCASGPTIICPIHQTDHELLSLPIGLIFHLPSTILFYHSFVYSLQLKPTYQFSHPHIASSSWRNAPPRH